MSQNGQNNDIRDADWINAYIGIYVDLWGCRLDREDGHTAPFSAIAAEMAEDVAAEWRDTLKVLTE